MKKTPSATSAQPRIVRCAIYTRKSTEEGLQQEFNSLDAQREAGEAYVATQKSEGWGCLPDRYDDGGFTGGNMERPAVRRLMKDIESGKVNCVVVYKVDRLSRSLLDFARMMETFDRHNVAFVSTTQRFDTSTPMGRLMLNVLLSFAQFERELTSERTRDKIAAARRQGKFAGGRPILGYNLISSPAGPRLEVNAEEAEQVRAIFELYVQHEALLPTVAELNRRGWTTKCWSSKAGVLQGGKVFDKVTLFRMLTNITYRGKVQHHEEVHAGQHAAILDEAIWQRAQAILQRNGRTGGGLVRNRYGALLKGLLRCTPCGCAMSHTYTASKGRRYRYYTCIHAQKRGWHTCPSKSIPAPEIERFVVEQIRGISQDPTVLEETLREAQEAGQRCLSELRTEEQALQAEMARLDGELRRLVGGKQGGDAAAQMADVQDRLRVAEQRLTEVREQIIAMSGTLLSETDVQTALAAFTPLWDSLSPRDQARIIHLLVERVDYDGGRGTVSVTFRANGIKALAQQEVAA